MKVYHTPVLVKQVLDALRVGDGGVFVDCTVGEGGHAAAVLETSKARVVGMDLDAEALAVARRRLGPYGERFVAVQANFSMVEETTRRRGLAPVEGVLFDLGLSSMQLETAERGFSFQRDAPLDMRFDPSQRLSASDIVNGEDERTLADLIYRLGDEPRAGRIAREIVRIRPVHSTIELAGAVTRAAGGGRRGRIHPATRTFQAIRMAVNDELDNLRRGLSGSIRVLKGGGRLVAIAYHSLEDRLVKAALRTEASDCICPPETPQCACGHTASITLVNRRVIKPAPDEVRANPRSRSARMRVAARI